MRAGGWDDPVEDLSGQTYLDADMMGAAAHLLDAVLGAAARHVLKAPGLAPGP